MAAENGAWMVNTGTKCLELWRWKTERTWGLQTVFMKHTPKCWPWEASSNRVEFWGQVCSMSAWCEHLKKVRSFQVVCHSLLQNILVYFTAMQGFHTRESLKSVFPPPTPNLKHLWLITFFPMPLSENTKNCQIHCCIWALFMQDPAMRGKAGILCFFGPMMSCQQCRSRTGHYRSLRGCGGQAMKPLMVWKPTFVYSV